MTANKEIEQDRGQNQNQIARVPPCVENQGGEDQPGDGKSTIGRKKATAKITQESDRQKAEDKNEGVKKHEKSQKIFRAFSCFLWLSSDRMLRCMPRNVELGEYWLQWERTSNLRYYRRRLSFPLDPVMHVRECLTALGDGGWDGIVTR